MPVLYVRNRLTWLLYFMLAFYAFYQAAPGPTMPFVGDELDLSYTVRGMHFSAFALGLILAGITGDRVARRITRQRTFWLGVVGMLGGMLMLLVVRHPALTIAAMFIMGFLGSFVLVVIQATLSDHHGENRAIALTESNVIASVGAMLAPLLIGGAQQIGIGWRVGLFSGTLFAVGLVWWFRDVRLPKATPIAEGQTYVAQLPKVFWAYWLVIVLGVGTEWSVGFWGAEFLEQNADLARADAATLMSIYFGAIVVGRIIASRLTRRIPLPRLLMGAFMLVALGFVPFWLGQSAAVNIVGLFITGLGIANLFPLGLSMASSVVAPHQADAASGRISSAAGVAILLAPQILGAVADEVGITNAYGLVMGLIVLALIGVTLANRVARENL